MKFYKLLWRDALILPNALLQRAIFSVLLFSFLYVSFVFEVFHYFPAELELPENINRLGVSLGDLILVEIGGTLPRVTATKSQIVMFPAAFFVVQIIPCGFTLNYLNDDLSRGGIQVLIRLGDMRIWWLSKCLRGIATAVLFYAVGFSCWALLCAATGKSLSLVPNASVFEAIFSAYFTNAAQPPVSFFVSMLILPILATVTLSLCEMTLTLFIRPIYAFLAICVYLIMGLYIISPAFLTNYAASVRSATIGVYNFSPVYGVGLCLAICTVAVTVGAVRVRSIDIVGERG